MKKAAAYLFATAAVAICVFAGVYYLDRNPGAVSAAITAGVQLARPFLMVILIVALGIIACFFMFKKEKRWLGSAAVVIVGLLSIVWFGDALLSPSQPQVAQVACSGVERSYSIGSQWVTINPNARCAPNIRWISNEQVTFWALSFGDPNPRGPYHNGGGQRLPLDTTSIRVEQPNRPVPFFVTLVPPRYGG